MIGRISKPFNPMLGETYELVTPDLRFVSEAVSHHPPVTCGLCEGDGFWLFDTSETVQRFTGKSVQVTQKRSTRYRLFLKDGTTEEYEGQMPMLVVGNIIVGERYAEPQGPSKITNHTTGHVCLLDYKARGIWTTREEDKHFVSGTVHD